ncbi:hypothetical protein VAWG002_40310 [Aeromonas veronii]|nr:hypothetical protein VAWG002_40310 [Aeromonas veronii]
MAPKNVLNTHCPERIYKNDSKLLIINQYTKKLIEIAFINTGALLFIVLYTG